ncbi:MAG: acyl-CoA dehydrogenase family protein [Dehalococcoidia bacterium]|jgi:alkylation response protein AidB-like acyl-CoA dehydrogenase
MIGFTLTEAQMSAQKKARDFAEKHMKPYARELDSMPSPHFDWKIVDRFAAAGYTSFFLPKEYGGGGVDALTVAIICEEMAVVCAGICSVLGASMLAANCLKAGGTEEQKKTYLSLLAEKKGRLGAMAITEPSAGSDLGGVSTLAVKDNNDYVISGTKTFISNAGIADLYIVLATTDPAKKYAGLDFFIVPADTPGLSAGKIEDKMGLRASPTGTVILENVRVPAKNLLGKPGTGFLVAMQALDLSRPMMSVDAIGIARAAYEAALEYTRKRVQFGKPLFKNQAVAFALADMATTIDAARLLTWRACCLLDSGQEFTKEASMAKLFSSEAAVEICSKATHLMGAVGYTRDLPVEKFFRDAKAMTILEGTSEIQRRIIAQEL